MLELLLEWERSLFFMLNGSEYSVLDYFFYIISYKWTWIPFYLTFVLIFIYRKHWQEIVCLIGAITLLVLLCDQISSGFFKPFFERYRPTHHPNFAEEVQTVFGYKGGRYGFISSHAANAFGFFIFMSKVFRNRILTGILLTFALLNGYSRIYLGVHFISDVVAGAVVGICIGYFVYWLYKMARKRWLKLSSEHLHTSLFSQHQSYLATYTFLLTIVGVLLFDNQIVDFLF